MKRPAVEKASTSAPKHQQFDYRLYYRFVVKLGNQLGARSITVGYASIYLYKLVERAKEGSILPQSICLHATSDPVIKTRDVINMAHSLLHPASPLLPLDDLYHTIKEGLLEMELLVARLLRYHFDFEHPHQDLCMILALLRDFFPTQFAEAKQSRVDLVAGTLLRDLYAECPRLIDNHRPLTVALVITAIAMAALQLRIEDESWTHVVEPAMNVEKLRRLKTKFILALYAS